MSAKKNGTNGNGHKKGNGAKTPSPREDLSLKQERWYHFWLQTGNLTESSRLAGYEGNDDALTSIGRKNLQHHEIKQRIAAMRAQANVETEEVIGRLVAISRADILDAFEDSDSPQIKLLREKNLGHLVRKIRIKRYTEGKGQNATPVEITELEFHNALAATTQLCKVLGIERQPAANPADDKRRVDAAIKLWQDATGGTREDAIRYLAPQMPEVLELGKIG